MAKNTETHELGSESRAELAAYIERIESLTEEKRQLGAKIKSEFDDADHSGYSKEAIKQIIKERAADAQKSIEQRAVTAAYRRALGSLAGTPLGDWARGWMANEARINKPDPKGAEMDDFMKTRKAKAKGEEGDARAA